MAARKGSDERGKLKKRTRDLVTMHTAGSKSCRASGRNRG